MPQSDSRDALLAAVQTELTELENLCGTMETALMRRSWIELDRAIVESRRVTHALQNALDAASPVRDDEIDEAIFRRIRYVQGVRENQMQRLQHFNKAVGDRLALLTRWRAALRSMAGPKRRNASRLATLDQLS